MLRWPFSWMFYWIGDLVSRIGDVWPEHWDFGRNRDEWHIGYIHAAIWRSYNWAMRTSDTIQGETDWGPWKGVQPKGEATTE